LKPGELYSVSRVDRAGKLLYETYLFNQVKTVFDTVPKDSLDLTFELDPAKTRIASFGFGLQTAGADERHEYGDSLGIIPDRLSLSVGWEHLNLFGRGVSFSTEVIFNPTFTGDYESELNLRNRYPNFLPWGLALTVSPYWKHGFYKNNTSKTYHILGAEAGLERVYSDKLKTGFSVQVRKILTGEREDQTNFTRASLVYDSRDDFFSPTTGIYLFPYADWAGRPLGGSNNFLRMAVDFRNYLDLPLNVVLAWRAHGGWLIPHSGDDYDDISLFEKFTVGGAGSLRAILNRSMGPEIDTIIHIDTDTAKDGSIDTFSTYNHYGTLLFLYSFEIRTPYISDLLGLVAFFDIGLCERTPNEIGENWTWGPGLGVRIKTPIGPVRLDYAKDAREPFDWNNWLLGGRIDIGFLQAF
ncbi:BamA/TamA family outer membrane protein, partial [candidate division WOR-3 bacterium]|nr:BamA/TamA family outer membrane protein [candidate division WOR-3 bacterium]MBD3365529.1 BamA/TamA family outer membrane protein [candidate division WOR-3 bacterium]